jgi:hypothetical protein
MQVVSHTKRIQLGAEQPGVLKHGIVFTLSWVNLEMCLQIVKKQI